MNSMNDLIRSHDMYDDSHDVSAASYTPYTGPQYEPTPPPPEPPPVAYTPPQYYDRQPQYPVPRPMQQSHYLVQDRQTIQAMMHEIVHMQRRLEIMMSSCQAMIERTYISHEYHHIARFQHGRTDAPTQQQYRQSSPVHTMYEPMISQPTPQQSETPIITKDGVFDGTHMISADGDMYTVEASYVCSAQLIEGDIMQASVYRSGKISFTLAEPTAREHIMGILSTHSAGSPHYIVQTANKAYKVLTEAVESAGATPGKQVLLTVPAGGESEWAAIERVF